MRRILLPVLLLLVGSLAARSQTLCQAAASEIAKLRAIPGQPVIAKDPAKTREPLRTLVNMDQLTNCLTTAAAHPLSLSDVIQRFENSRNDQQEGSSATSGGSTSVVAKGPVAEVLSVATEYGAITQAVNGQTITLKGNLANLPYALVKQGLLPVCALNIGYLSSCAPKGYLSALGRFSFGVTFDTSRGNQNLTATPQGGSTSGSSTTAAISATAQPIVFQAQRQQISNVTGRVELLDHRNIASQSFLKNFQTSVGNELKSPVHNLATAASALRDAIDASKTVYSTWQQQTIDALNAASDDVLETVWQRQLMVLVGMLRGEIKNFDQLVAQASSTYNAYFAALQQTIDTLSKSSVIALEYINERALGQPDTSNFRLILDVPLSNKWKFIANGAITLYNSLPSGTQGLVKRFRDAQAAGELSYSFGSTPITGPGVLSLAGYYQDQRTAAVLNVDPSNPILGVTFVGLSPNAKAVLAETGNIKLVQLKLTMGGMSSFKVPLSVSYSNRTELLNKPTWRAQIGITYNLDSLFTKAGN